MDITREYLEGEIVNVRKQGVAAAQLVQQAIGAEMALRSMIVALETNLEGTTPSETSED